MSIIQGTAHSGGQYQIERSLRFNSADTAYLNRTPASAGTTTTWTWSAWVKRSVLGTQQYLFYAASAGANAAGIDFLNDQLRWYQNNGSQTVRTTQVFRDVSSWYHFVVVMDTTNGTSTDRLRMYVNGSRITAFASATYPSSGGSFNNNVAHAIGRDNTYGTEYLNAYQTEVNFIDGQALTPSSFGQTNASTGVWEPKAYTGTYGTNGFFLKFADNSGTTSTTLGKDSSGNGNNWTPNNFSVTAGAGNDSLVDTPTSYGTDTGAGGEVRGNYCTLNPLEIVGAANTFANGNLDVTTSASVVSAALGTLSVSSGKWYCEFTPSSVTGICQVGVTKRPVGDISTNGPSQSANAYVYINSSGNKGNNNSVSAYGATYTSGDVIGVALDLDAGTLVFYKNGVSQGTAYTGLSGEFTFLVGDSGNASTIAGSVNFGQRPFAYTAPSGFKALCTQNLPTPTIGATSTTQANKYFDINLWTGTGASRSITNSGAMQPDLVWTKDRGVGTSSHGLFDSVRGNTKVLSSNSTVAEGTVTDEVTSFNSDGFSLGVSSNGYTNFNGRSFVGWQWKANGAGSSNTSGTITSTVSANTTSGFSIVTYTGTGANATVGHGLGVAPKMVIVKQRDVSGNEWCVYNANLPTPGTAYIFLNSTAAVGGPLATIWNSTNPTSSVFSVGTIAQVNQSTKLYVAYCFAEVAGYSKFGSYTGNGSADGPFVFTNFRPAFVMFKRTDSTENWLITDYARNTYNVVSNRLYPNLSAAEDTGTPVDFLSNGFKIRAGAATPNISSGTYIYAAFAETAFRWSLAR